MTRRSEQRLELTPEIGRASRPTAAKPVPTVVAIPALNEQDNLPAALDALLLQRNLDGRSLPPRAVKIAVLANNCTDNTAALVRKVADEIATNADMPEVHLREVHFSPDRAHAGQARRAALDFADELLAGQNDGLLCTTDADSRAYPDWIAQTWAERARGADAVAGTVELDPTEAAHVVWPEPRRLEARYSALQAELLAALDPDPYDPWPNHIWAWGASLAVTRQAYRKSGGLPQVTLAEDRAFIDLLRRRDCRIRHSLAVRVMTSCRVNGRAPGGLADLIAAYKQDINYPCDAELLPTSVIEARARGRALLRTAFGGPATPAVAKRLNVGLSQLAEALAQPYFGEAWAMMKVVMPACYGSRLSPADLPHEIEEAARLLATVKGRGAAGRLDRSRAGTAGLWTASVSPPR